eukprot:GHVS01077669.1.p1 GENE.GHVS01077669.1~~GHVS01077669.1.p1  ORF type:complete len:537 (+),score=145.98 GHVS01077669.1:215-1825(+)
MTIRLRCSFLPSAVKTEIPITNCQEQHSYHNSCHSLWHRHSSCCSSVQHNNIPTAVLVDCYVRLPRCSSAAPARLLSSSEFPFPTSTCSSSPFHSPHHSQCFLFQQTRGKKYLPFHYMSNKQRKERIEYLKQFHLKRQQAIQQQQLAAAQQNAATTPTGETDSTEETGHPLYRSPTPTYSDLEDIVGRPLLSPFKGVRLSQSFQNVQLYSPAGSQQQQQLSPHTSAVDYLADVSTIPPPPASVDASTQTTTTPSTATTTATTTTATAATGTTTSGTTTSSTSGTTSSSTSLLLKVKFDPTRESVRGSCSLPHPLPTNSTVLVFCPDTIAPSILQAGADFVGLHQLVARVAAGWTGFDKCLASPDVLPQIIKLAKVLGPKRLMPSSRAGTVCRDLVAAVRQLKSGSQIDFRAEDNGDIRVVIAVEGFDQNQILANIQAVVQAVLKHKPASSKAETVSNNNNSGAEAEEMSFDFATLRQRKTAFLEKQPAIRELQKSSNNNKTTADTDFLLSCSLRTDGIAPICLDTTKLIGSSGYVQ